MLSPVRKSHIVSTAVTADSGLGLGTLKTPSKMGGFCVSHRPGIPIDFVHVVITWHSTDADIFSFHHSVPCNGLKHYVAKIRLQMHFSCQGVPYHFSSLSYLYLYDFETVLQWPDWWQYD